MWDDGSANESWSTLQTSKGLRIRICEALTMALRCIGISSRRVQREMNESDWVCLIVDLQSTKRVGIRWQKQTKRIGGHGQGRCTRRQRGMTYTWTRSVEQRNRRRVEPCFELAPPWSRRAALAASSFVPAKLGRSMLFRQPCRDSGCHGHFSTEAGSHLDSIFGRRCGFLGTAGSLHHYRNRVRRGISPPWLRYGRGGPGFSMPGLSRAQRRRK